MDVTTVQMGKSTRRCLASYRDLHDLPNYNEAILRLLATTDVEVACERPTEPAEPIQ